MPTPTIESLGSVGMKLQDGEITDTIQYLVSGCESKYDGFLALMNDSTRGYLSGHPVFGNIVVRGIEPVDPDGAINNGESAFLFNASYAKPDGKQEDPNEDLKDRSPLVALDWFTIQESCDLDVYGNLVCNSAGDPFDPPQTTDIVCLKFTAIVYRDDYHPETAMQYVNRVNNEVMHIFQFGSGYGLACQPRTLRCNNFVPAQAYHYWNTLPIPIKLEFEWRPKGFDRSFLDQGMRAWASVTGGNKLGKIIMTGQGGMNPPAKPILLDGTGKPLVADGLATTGPGFSAFTTNPGTNKPPAYITPFALANGGYTLKYRFVETADFNFFTNYGL